MDYNTKQNILEMKRKFLIDVAEELNCTVNDAVCFAIEEYYLERPNTQYSYHDYKDHYMSKIIGRNKNYPNHGKMMTEMLEHLFDSQISECYAQIKKFVYSYFEYLHNKGEGWSPDTYTNEFNVLIGVYADEVMELDGFNFDSYGWMPKNDSLSYADAPIYVADRDYIEEDDDIELDYDEDDIDPETLHIEDNEKKNDFKFLKSTKK